jgi:hypothetical protein
MLHATSRARPCFSRRRGRTLGERSGVWEIEDEVKFEVALFLTLSHTLFFEQPGAGGRGLRKGHTLLHRSRCYRCTRSLISKLSLLVTLETPLRTALSNDLERCD